MKILILGATGRTGKWVLKFALEKGYVVNLLVRDTNKVVGGENLTIFQGNPSNICDLKKAAIGCEAVVSVLNISRTSDFPWAKLRTPKNFLSDVMRNIIAISEEQNIKRLVVCSAWGVAETNVDLPFWFRWTIKYSNISVAYANHERQEGLVKQTDLAWTIVRPVGLVNTNKTGQVQVSYANTPKPKLIISRKAVAKFMVNALETKVLMNQTPVISRN